MRIAASLLPRPSEPPDKGQGLCKTGGLESKPKCTTALQPQSLASRFRKIRAPIKIKSALPPPPPKKPKIHPPKARNFMDMGFSCRKSAFFQASIKLTHPFLAQNCGQKFYGREEFSDFFNRGRNRKEFPQREANLAIFHRNMHRNRNSIIAAKKSQPISQKESLHTI